MSSTLDISIEGIPDGSFMTVLDQADGTRIQRGSIVYTDEAMSVTLPIDGGITVKGYVDDSLNPSSNGAYLEGVTVGGVIFTPLSLFQSGEQGAWYDPSDLSTLFQDAAGTTPVTLDGQPAGLVTDKSGNGNNASQPVAAARPTYNDTPDRLTLDKVDDSIVVNVPVGGWVGSMVIGTNEGTASYGVTIPAGDYTIGSSYFAGSSINGVLIRDGVVSASDLAKVEQAFVDDGAKASYGEVTNFTGYWSGKAELTTFPLIDTSSGTSFRQTWQNGNLTSFPLLDVSSGIDFFYAWLGNSLTSFPLLDFSSASTFFGAWFNNSNLSTFPANMFDNCSAANFGAAFNNTSLSQSSIDGILVSINSNGTSNGTFSQSGGSAPSATGETAITAMRSRGWTITVTGGF